MYKRILVPVDGSPGSAQALDAAIGMARESGGTLRLVNIAEDLAYLTGYDLYAGSTAELIRMAQESSAKIVGDAAAKATAAGVAADTATEAKFGLHLGETMAQHAKLWNADLIVLATHGRKGLGRALMGSGAEQIIRMAPVPVLVIRVSGAGAENSRIQGEPR